MSWNDILKEVIKRKANGQKADILSDNELKAIHTEIKKNKTCAVKSQVTYRLGTEYGNIYFTKREAECMVWLLKGKTINSVAGILNLSPRTVEYYIKNMKTKLGCRTKFELIDLVHASEFIKNVDFKI